MTLPRPATATPQDQLLIEDFIAMQRRSRGRGLRQMRQRLLRSLSEFLGDRGLLAATTDDITTWVPTLKRGDQIPWRDVHRVHVFYLWARDMGFIAESPAVGATIREMASA
jgi:hypothetical protein